MIINQAMPYSIMRSLWSFIRRHPDRAVYHYKPNKLQDNLTQWFNYLPEVTPYYAVKCNNMDQIIADMIRFRPDQMSFDCASLGEIRQIREFGIKGSNIIYANPVKSTRDLMYAKNNRVALMTIDSTEELEKIGRVYQKAEKVDLIMRLSVDDSQSVCRFSTKFGLCRDNLPGFFAHYQKMHKLYPTMCLSGVSFHVGSNCQSVESYNKALTEALYCRQLASLRGIHLDILDIGGGLPAPKTPELHSGSCPGPREISHLFHGTFKRVIAEPGRYMVGNVLDLYVPVIGCNHTRGRYYINDSVYGSFSCLMYDYAKLHYTVYRRHNNGQYVALPANAHKTSATVFGASCDSLDVILHDQPLPELALGDYLCFHQMGAYTYSSSSEFNGLEKPLIYCQN